MLLEAVKMFHARLKEDKTADRINVAMKGFSELWGVPSFRVFEWLAK